MQTGSYRKQTKNKELKRRLEEDLTQAVEAVDATEDLLIMNQAGKHPSKRQKMIDLI